MTARSDLIIQGSESKEEDLIEKKYEMKGEIASENDLTTLLCNIYDSLTDEEAVEIKVYRECILVGKRHKNQSSNYTKKFINFGLSKGNRTVALGYAIRAIDDALPDYCYKAIDGDIDALRETTKHLIKVYEKKMNRLEGLIDNIGTAAGMYAVIEDLKLDPQSTAEEVNASLTKAFMLLYKSKRNACSRLEIKDNDEFLASTEPVLIEIPKNYEVFHDKNNDYVSIVAGDDITP